MPLVRLKKPDFWINVKLRQGKVILQELTRIWSIKAIILIGSLAVAVACDGNSHNDVGFNPIHMNEVRSTGIAVTGAAIVSGVIHGESYPGIGEREEALVDAIAVYIMQHALRAGVVGLADHTVANSGKKGVVQSVVIFELVEQPCGGQPRRGDPSRCHVQEANTNVASVGCAVTVFDKGRVGDPLSGIECVAFTDGGIESDQHLRTRVTRQERVNENCAVRGGQENLLGNQCACANPPYTYARDP